MATRIEQSPLTHGRQRSSLDFGFDFRAAETEDFARVLHRLSILVSFIRWQEINQVSKFMQQGKDLRVQRASRIGPHANWAYAPNSPRSAFPLNFATDGLWCENRSFLINSSR